MSDFLTRYQQDASRILSPKMWSQCPRSSILSGHFDKGWGCIDDFVSKGDLSEYTVTQATTGTFALDSAKGGVALLDCASATAAQGVQAQRSAAVGAAFAAANGKIFFETLVKAADIATGPEFFAGLSVIDTTIIAASALSAQSIGFYSVTDDGILLSGVKDASAAQTGTGHTLVDGTWVKLGFIVHQSSKVEFFVDGKLVNTETANVPTAQLVPSFVCQSGGTTDPIVHIDWQATFQVDNLTR